MASPPSPPDHDPRSSTLWVAAGAAVMGVLLGGAAVWLGRRDAERAMDPTATPPAMADAWRMATEQSVSDGDTRAPLVDAVARTRDTVVNLETPRGMGAGVIVEPSGLVLTNYHVIADALVPPPAMFFGPSTERLPEQPTVLARFENDRAMRATVLVADRDEDLAVLSLIADSPDETFPSARLGSSAKLQVGQEVFAIGNPFGLPHTVSKGIISAVDRVGILQDRQQPMIQLDASVNLGNSGGPLFDLEGSLIGIVTARREQAQGIAFALPIDHVRAFLRAVSHASEGRSGMMGVTTAREGPLPDAVRQLGFKAGIELELVEAGQAAAKAGIRPGDVIVGLRGKRLDGLPEADDPQALGLHLQATVRSMLPGETLPVTVVRGNEILDLEVEIGGASVRDQTFIDAEELLGLALDPDSDVPIVKAVRPGFSLAPWAGFIVEARLTELMGAPVRNMTELSELLNRLRELVRRQGTEPTVFVKFERDEVGAMFPVRVR